MLLHQVGPELKLPIAGGYGSDIISSSREDFLKFYHIWASRIGHVT